MDGREKAVKSRAKVKGKDLVEVGRPAPRIGLAVCEVHTVAGMDGDQRLKIPAVCY